MSRRRSFEFKAAEVHMPATEREPERRTTIWRVRPEWARDVLAPTILFGALAAVGVTAAVMEQWGVAAGAAVALLVGFWRQYVHDLASGETQVAERQKASRAGARERPERELVPTTISENNRREVIGKFAFRESEWGRLAAALRENGRTVTRALLEDLYRDDGETKMFPSTTKRYQEYCDEFARLGWLDESNVLTDAAVQWFDGQGIRI